MMAIITGIDAKAAILLLATFALAPAPLRAQHDPLSFRYLTIADGLSQNAVSDIIQDRRGFMWFGTKDGLNRYDGYTFVVFRHRQADSTTVSDSEITALLEDSRGWLWVGTRTGGLNRFDRRLEIFHHYPHGPTAPITSVREDGDGNLWIATDGAGLYRLPATEVEGASATFEQHMHVAAHPGSLSGNRVFDVLVDHRGTLWAGTENGLDRLDAPRRPATGFVHYRADSTSSEGLIDSQVSALYEDSRRRLWVGSVAGVSVFDEGRDHIAHYYHRYRTYRYGWGETIAMLEDRRGRIWISTRSELMRLEPTTGRFHYFRHDPAVRHGINSNVPTALFRDRSDVIWIGTNGFGINLYDPKADRFKAFRRPENRPYRQSGFSVYTLFEDSQGRIWVDAGMLYRWDRATGEFTTFETSSDRPADFGNTGVWSIVEDPPGYLWAGTYEGLYHYELSTGRYRHSRHDPADPHGLPEKQVKDVYKDRNGALWVVTENYITHLMDPVRGRFRSYRYSEQLTSGEWSFPSTHQDRDGNFWFGSNHGLVRFDPATETFRYYRNDPNDSASLSHNVLRSIEPDPGEPDRYLWIGTAGGGLDRFDLLRETFSHFTEEDGLPNNVVYGVLADNQGRLWLSTNRGLSRFDPRTLEFRNYDEADGLQSNEFNSGAYFKSRSGELFFGGIYGFNYFFPDDVEDNPHVPPVVITGFKRANRYETVGHSASLLAAAISETDALRLSYLDNVITFEFAALDYSAPAKNRYAYRMAGFNDDWIESGSVHTATYTNLPPGRYTFEVRGSNNDGVWNEQGAALAISIMPPWWRTWWAYALYGLLFMSTLYGLRRREMNRLVLENRLALEHVEAEKLRELDRARRHFFANISHEFRTPLTLTLGPLDDLLARRHGQLSAEMAEQLELARRNAARVLDLINQILDLARLEARQTPLRARSLDLRDFVRRVADTFGSFAERKSLAFDVTTPDDPVVVYADPEHLEKILSNLISNAFKFTPAGGTVRVAVRSGGEAAHVTIRDSGPGIPAAELPRVFDRFHRVTGSSTQYQPGTGIGLALARELVELHRGSLSVQSEQGFGSTFTLTLRLGHAHLAPDQLVSGDDVSRERREVRLPSTDPTAEPLSPHVRIAEEDATTVLVVEDNGEVRAYLKRHLAPAYHVIEAANGEQGLELTRRVLPDLVLSDVMMSGLDGYALCRAIKQDPETDFIPVVLLTARAAPEDRLTGLHELADDYLTKPFDVPELLARIENLIASRKRLRERFSGARLTLHPGPIDVVPADARFLEQVRSAIEENLGDEDFGVERLARLVAHSRGHLHRRLHELLNENPSDLIRRMRLERAAQLIEAGSDSIATIAYSVGFKSVAHFSNRFNDQFGVRPSIYKTQRERRVQPGTNSH